MPTSRRGGSATLTDIDPGLHTLQREDHSARIWVRGHFDVALADGARIAGRIAATACAPSTDLWEGTPAAPVLPGGHLEADVDGASGGAGP